MSLKNENKFMITYKLPGDQSTGSLNYFMKIDASCAFEDLKQKVEPFLFIERKLPKYTPRYYWIADHGYEIEIGYQMDFSIFMEEFNDEDLKHIYVSPLKIKPNTDRPSKTDAGIGFGARAQSTPKPNEHDIWNFVIHDNVSCDECGLEPLIGFRYKCFECTNYDLCESCEAQHKHPEHMMIRIPKNSKISFAEVKHRASTHRLKKERKSAERRCSHKSRKESEEEAAADQAAGGGRSSSGENRRHGRKHHKRHVRNSIFTNLYEMIQDFAENSAAAAFAAATVALNAASGVGDNNAITAQAAQVTSATGARSTINEAAAGSSSAKNSRAAGGSSSDKKSTVIGFSSAGNSTGAGPSSATNAQNVDPKPGSSRYANMQPKQQQSTEEQVKIERKMIPPATVPISTKGNITESLINFAKITADLLAYENAINGSGAIAAMAQTQSKAAASNEQEKEKEKRETEDQMPSTSSVAQDQNKIINDDNVVIDKQPTKANQMMKPVDDLNDNEAKKDDEIIEAISKIPIVDSGEKERQILLAQVASALAGPVSKPEEHTKDQSAGTTPSKGNSCSSSVIDDWQILDANSSFDITDPDNSGMEAAADVEQNESPTSTQQTQTAQEPTVSTSTASTNTDVESSSLAVEPNPSGQIPQQPSQSQEMRAVPVYHADDRINTSVLAMMSMGFSNEGAWLTQLLENVDGNISAALDLMSTTQCNSA